MNQIMVPSLPCCIIKFIDFPKYVLLIYFSICLKPMSHCHLSDPGTSWFRIAGILA